MVMGCQPGSREAIGTQTPAGSSYPGKLCGSTVRPVQAVLLGAWLKPLPSTTKLFPAVPPTRGEHWVAKATLYMKVWLCLYCTTAKSTAKPHPALPPPLTLSEPGQILL